MSGRFRKTARFVFSFGGYDGLSPVAKEGPRDRDARRQNELLAENTRLLREQNALLAGRPRPEPFPPCPGCGASLARAGGRIWVNKDGTKHQCDGSLLP